MSSFVLSINVIFILLLVSTVVSSKVTDFGLNSCKDTASGDGQRPSWSVAVALQGNESINFVSNQSFPGILLSTSLVLIDASFLMERLTFELRNYKTEHYKINLSSNTESNKPTSFGITHVRIHPNFKPGFWAEAENRFVLLHLSAPINGTGNVGPVCLPNSQNSSLVNLLFSSLTSNLLTGWNLQENNYSKLRLKVQKGEKCKSLWEQEGNVHGFISPYPYVGRWCALAVTDNSNNATATSNNCSNYDITVFREIDGKQYFAGIVNNLDSINLNGMCRSNHSLLFFEKMGTETFKWIEDNIKCGPDKFTCSTGECINLTNVCNKVNDCSDSSDENFIYCRSLCPDGEFACGIDDCRSNSEVIFHCNNTSETGIKLYVWILIGVTVAITAVAFVILVYSCRRVRNLKDEIRNLTPSEEFEFMRGTDITRQKESNGRPPGTLRSRPWDKAKEIPRGMILIEHELNRGHFGIVHKAKLFDKKSRKFRCDVAVKLPIPSIRVMEFKALLDEVKVLASVGSHGHVIRFLGACTSNIRKREVILVMEYCSNGSLLNYLKKNRHCFNSNMELDGITEMVDNPGYIFRNSQIVASFNDITLLTWCTQAAAGLEYLASKHIIHRDVAARNLLLTSSMRVKISDFGFSRKLEGTEIYSASPNEFPWKWLAPESLKPQACFSEKTDIWAFGVTLWEIYSLGETPYEGMQWDPLFIQDLIGGYRLEQPLYCDEGIYELMQKCWSHDAANRPTFSQVKAFLLSTFQEIGREFDESTNTDSVLDEYFEVNGAETD